ncbi:MAG: PAS domain S-box protein [Nitrospinae bacterium]|nr:PAS domain S-box protein [Nitrospinota bacterium]
MNDAFSPVRQPAANPPGRRYPSPRTLFIATAVAVFLAELTIMLALERWSDVLGFSGHALLDSLSLILLVAPVMYFYFYRPMEAVIEESKALAADLRVSEERYRHFVGAMSDVFWEVDANLAYTHLALRPGNVYGYAPEEMKGRQMFEFMPREAARRAFDEFMNKLANREPVRDMERWITAKNGDLFCILTNAAPILDEHGAVAGLRGSDRDITAKKRAEEALRISETKYRIIAENYYDWELWLNPRGDFVFSSPSCERITGYAAEEFEKNPHLLLRIIHPDDRARFEEHLSAAIHPRRGRENFEFTILRKDGAARRFSHVCAPVFDNDGHFMGTRISHRDVTDRVDAERRRSRSETMLRAVVETAEEGVVVAGADGRVTLTNRNLLDLFGYREGELDGQMVELLLPERHRGQYTQVNGALRGWSPGRFLGVRTAVAGVGKDGVEFPLEIRFEETRDPEGELYFTGFFRPLTEGQRPPPGSGEDHGG